MQNHGPSAGKVPHVLLALYLVEFVILAIRPYDRATWWAENIPILLIVGVLVYLYPRFRFSNGSYFAMSALIFMHTIGGHFTFELVPFDAITDLFGFERNNYDRIAHFSVGFYAYPLAEILHRRRSVSSTWVLLLFPVFAVFTVAGVYEIIEWWYAVLAGGKAGAAFLGSQGDIWDAQKDILADGLGAVCATAIFGLVHRRNLAGD
jgi:putative membrane protein